MSHTSWRKAVVIWTSAVTSMVLPGFATDPDGLTRVTSHDARDWDPYWSPDGRRIAFTSDRTGNSEIWILDVVATSPAPRRASGRRIPDH